MSKLNRTFQRLRRERRINFTDISQKCDIPLNRVEELDNDADFTNKELASICDALGISIESFIKESESTRMDYPYLIKVKTNGNLEESELYEAIYDIESERMNNAYDREHQCWKHSSFDEAVVVLENARNWLSFDFPPPYYHREGHLLAFLTYMDDQAYIDGKEVVGIRFNSKGDLFDSMDFLDDPLDDFRDFDDDLY